MRRFRLNCCVPGWLYVLRLGVFIVLGLLGTLAWAQPTNDNFANAQVISGIWGSVTNSNVGATAQPNEPSHAGFPPAASIWYSWTAPLSGEVSFDTVGSTGLTGTNVVPMDTVLAVYTGTELARLTQSAANDDLFPFAQKAIVNQIDYTGRGGGYRTPNLPYQGPSSLRFNAVAGTTYYIAVDSKLSSISFGPFNRLMPTFGDVMLTWAYAPSGIFRFASEDFTTGFPTYMCGQGESGRESTDYEFGVDGVLVTVTRVAGSSGRMLVDYSTLVLTNAPLPVDLPASEFQDYFPVQGTLVFDNFEMSKSIVIPISFGSFGANSNVDFAVVLSNPRPAAAESSFVSPPRLDPTFSTGIVHILNLNIDPNLANNFDTNGVFTDTTNLVFNFDKRVHRYPRNVNEWWSDMDVLVTRGGTNQAAATLTYRINNYLGSDSSAGEEDNNLFPLMPGSDFATPDPVDSSFIRGVTPDFTLATGSISFGANDNVPKHIHFVLTNDTRVKFNKDFHITLYMPTSEGPKLVGTLNETVVTILGDCDHAPAGAVDQYYNPDHGFDMRPQLNSNIDHPGADGPVFDLKVLAGDTSLIAGQFGAYNGTIRNGIARINSDGSLDPSFDPGDGLGDPYNDFISAVSLTADGHIYIGGSFSFFGNAALNSIARLNSNGSVDTSFAPGPFPGVNGSIWTVVAMSDGSVLIGGDFTTVNGYPAPYLARMLTNGLLDTSFSLGTNAPNDAVHAIAIANNGKVVIGGDFTQVGGFVRKRIARLNADGTVDTTFDPGTGGVDDRVSAIALQSNDRVLIGGEFLHINVTPCSRIARLTSSGSIDPSFNPGIGANDSVYSLVPQADGTIYVGGAFTAFNGTHRLGFTRIFGDGTVDTGFLDTAYNQFAGLHRRYFQKQSEDGVRPAVYASQVQSDGNVMIAGQFSQIGGGQVDANLRSDSDYPTNAYNLDVWYELKGRDGVRNRSNVARLVGGSTAGPGNVGLVSTNLSVNRSQSFLPVSLNRTNGTLGYASANFVVQPSLNATSGVDFVYNSVSPLYLSSWRPNLLSSVPNGNTRSHMDGFISDNFTPMDVLGHSWFGYLPSRVSVSLINNTIPGNRNTTVELANPAQADQFYLGGQNIPLGLALGRSTAPFTIVDDSKKTNILGFAFSSFATNESSGTAVITITRTGGSSGTVSVRASTTDGTAHAGVNYTAVLNQLISFGPGELTKVLLIPITDDHVSQPNGLTLNINLSSISGATYGISNSVLTLIDNDGSSGAVSFSAPAIGTNQTASAAILTVWRNGSDRGALTVQVITTNGTAIAGTDYIGLTNTLIWNDLEFGPRYVSVPLTNSGIVGPNKFFGAYITNALVNTTNAPGVLVAPLATQVFLTNDNSFGLVQFSAASYTVNENGGYITIPVIRTGGSAQTLTVNFATANGPLAVSSGLSPNFLGVTNTLTFGPGEVAKTFNVTVLNDGITNGPPTNFYFTVNLLSTTPTGALGFQTSARVYILDSSVFNVPAGSPDTAFIPNPGLDGDVYSVALQSDGKILAGGNFTHADGASRNRIARYNANAALDLNFQATYSGVNGAVNTVLVQTDGRIFVGGAFTLVNGINRNRLARLLGDGSLDTSFNPGPGADNTVYAAAETFMGGSRQLLVGGSFLNYNSTAHAGLVRLNADGSIDGTFNPSLAVNGTVYAIAVYPTNSIQAGKIVIAGEFTVVNGVGRNGIARLNPDGTLDNSFLIGTGTTNTVRALAIQLDGRILLGGSFTNFNGMPLNHIARLNVNGQVDSSFNTGLGTDDSVNAFVLQPDTRIVVVGLFSHANGVSRNRITRLLPDGTVDPAINFGLGADSFISSIALQPDGMMVIGGGFGTYDGQSRPHLARVYGGSLAGSGNFAFTASNFEADENSTNAVVTVRRTGGTFGNVTVDFATVGMTAVPGVNFSNIQTTLFFPVGETLRSVMIPVIQDFQITPDLLVSNFLSNPSPPAGLGNQPFAYLAILNDDSTVSFSSDSYSVLQNAAGNGFFVDVVRQGSTRGSASVDIFTTTNGTAIDGVDYGSISNTITFFPGETSIKVKIPVLNNPLATTDRTVVMQLTNEINTLLAAPYRASLTIQTTNDVPGELLFSMTNYVVGEGDGFLFVGVLRTNGHKGVVSVDFSTLPGSAPAGLKYVATNGTLTFNPNDTSKVFPVRILQEAQVEGNQTFGLVLSNATGGATLLQPTNVPVTILDDDVGLTFTSPFYVVPETAGTISVSVFRLNGTNAATTVHYSTTNLSATAGVNYVGITNATLTFQPGDLVKSFALQVLHDPTVTGDLSFGINLFNPSAPAQIGTPGMATVVLLDNEAGINFANTNLSVVTNADFSLTTNANYGVLKSSGTNLLITVVRSNANTGTVGAICTTADGTGKQGLDYGTNWASLVFSNGVAFQTFSVQIVTNQLVRGDRTFNVYLTNATPTNIAKLVVPYIATVTITDDTSGLSFSSAIYNVNENISNAVVTVSRSNWTNSTVSVDYFTSDGTGRVNTNYFASSGTLVFTNGETSKTFSVGVIDNHIVDGGHTVLLNLTNAIGNAAILGANPATLTIAETDGSLIIPAGVALVSESGPVNGAIDTNETVTILFGLRNANGTNTANLVATLVATNGVANPSGPQNYGVLVPHGPSASRPFTFTSTGTNGQSMQAILSLRDGATVLSNAVFNFVIGKTPAMYSNTTSIVINDLSAASPYPSTIAVSNLNGVVIQVTATLSNLNHTYPKDIDALLVSPTGLKTYLMAHCGGQIGVNNTTLTFDDSTNAVLPYASQITPGTYRPTAYTLSPPQFPPAAPPFATNSTAPPYNTNLSVFNGSSPNGLWALYIFDDSFLNTGTIANGWRLNLTVSGPVNGASDLALGMISTPPTVVASSNVTYTLSVTNFGPAGATNITVIDTLPPGTAYVSSSPSTGTVTNGGGIVSWNVGSLAKDAKATLTLVLQANIPGTITNSAVVSSITTDPNAEDDAASAVTTVVEPTADLQLRMVGSSDPVPTGYNLTYTLTMTNQGPATATALSIVDTLPSSVTFVSASSGGVYAAGKVTFANLGNLASGAASSVTITVKPTVPGTITNTATVNSAVTDPLKADNTASVKTVIQGFQMQVTYGPGSLTFSWPADVANAYLEAATNLVPPTVWTPMTNPPPILIGGQKTMTVPIGSGAKYFRLHGVTQ